MIQLHYVIVISCDLEWFLGTLSLREELEDETYLAQILA